MLKLKKYGPATLGPQSEFVDEARERREKSIYPDPQDFADSNAYQEACKQIAVERAKRLLDSQLGPKPERSVKENLSDGIEERRNGRLPERLESNEPSQVTKPKRKRRRGRKRDTNSKADDKRLKDWRDWRTKNSGGTEEQYCSTRQIDLGPFHLAKKRAEGRERYAKKTRQ